MNRRRTAGNPYLPAETNPFGQQENPFVPTSETIEQGIAPTEPEGPRVVTGPSTPQTAKPRGEVVTVDASLDRLKVAVVCEACGQRGLLRLGQVSDSTRCRCGSASVELLEASRRTAMPVMPKGVPSDNLVHCPGVGLEPTEKLYTYRDKATGFLEEELVASCPACNHKVKVKRDGTVGSHQITEAMYFPSYEKVKHLANREASRRTAVNDFDWNDESGDLVKYVQVSGDTELELVVSPEAPFKWFLWTNSPSGSDMLEAGRADDTESAKRAAETAAEFWAITVSSSRKRAEKECTCWEGYERVPGTEPCASGSCRKKTSRRTTANRVYEVLVSGYEAEDLEDSLDEDSYMSYTVTVAAPDAETAKLTAIEYSEDYAGLMDISAQVLQDLTGWAVHIDVTAGAKSKKRSHRRTASEGWTKSLNPHHFFKTVSAGDHTLNLFVSDVDYRWTVDAMVTGNSSSLELFEQGIGTSLEDAKRQAEQSAKFF